MRTTFALIAAVSLVLLSGCIGGGVPQEKYDALAASCDKAKNESAAALSAQMAKTSEADAQLSSCIAQMQSLEEEQTVLSRQNSALQAEAAVLAEARVKTALMGEYALAQQYYLDAYGPGKIINTAKLRNIDSQVASLNDLGLLEAWQGVRNCQTITECDSAKGKIIPYISNQTSRLAIEAAAIVGENAAGQ